MNRWSALTWLSVAFLVAIHGVDMELTMVYIGDNYDMEIFPPMRWAIKYYGISGALMFSRFLTYGYLYLALLHAPDRRWSLFTLVVCLLYYTAMINWLFRLGLCEWPFPSELR